jgi:phosphoglycolate phosphatase-like HAD superfamily hydrolase
MRPQARIKGKALAWLAVTAFVTVAACSPSPAPAETPPRSQAAPAAAADPLPSWNNGAARTAILEFVKAVTAEGGPDFVPMPQRIATFDNDGTLWSEQPVYFQFLFVLDRVRATAAEHPEWKTTQPFRAALEGDMKGVMAAGEKGIVQMFLATHTGMTVDEFDGVVREWLATARHPTTRRPYTQMIYQPMVEVLTYLRANGFRTFIVSGGGTEFMRVWAEQAYGIPPEQVIGSRGSLKYEVRDGVPVILKLPEVVHVDDGPGKPVGIAQMIGRRPIAAFGNSDGDFQMLEYTTTGASGRRLGAIVHHTDADREWAYDRGSSIGRLERGLDEAGKRGWVLIDMKQDWKTIHPAP